VKGRTAAERELQGHCCPRQNLDSDNVTFFKYSDHTLCGKILAKLNVGSRGQADLFVKFDFAEDRFPAKVS